MAELRCGLEENMAEGDLAISPAAVRHLKLALEQMDVLLGSNNVEEGLPSFVSLVEHLRAIQRLV